MKWSDVSFGGTKQRKEKEKALDVVKTALVLCACMIGVFNTAKKKENYIKNYHRMTPEELVSSAFQLFIRSIPTEKGENNK